MMKTVLISNIIFCFCLVFLANACKKDISTPSFSAKVENTSYSFDSLFASIDTSSAVDTSFYINIGANNTKTNYGIVIQCLSLRTKDWTGTYYFYSNPVPYPPPSKEVVSTQVFLKYGQNPSLYFTPTLNDMISNVVISKITSSTIEGNFSIKLQSIPNGNGALNNSQEIQMTGQFNVPYHFLP